MKAEQGKLLTGAQMVMESYLQEGVEVIFGVPGGANLPDAEARLLDALERELGVTLAPKVSRPRGLRSPRFLAVAAAFVATAGLLWSLGSLKREDEKPVLRGPTASSGSWNAQPRANLVGDGHLVLAWSEAPGATRYTVTFLGEDLQEIAHQGTSGETTISLDRTALPRGLAPGQSVLWRVTAFEGGDELARTGAAPLTIP